MSDIQPETVLKSLSLVCLLVGSVIGASVTFAGVAAAGNTSPTVTIESPSHEQNLTQQPTITGTASDDDTVTTVEIQIQRASDNKYFDATNGWQDDETWIEVASPGSDSVDWSFDTYDLNGADITDDGTYDVTARVTDNDGNTVEGERPDPRNPADADAGAITYVVDTTRPVVSGVSVTDDTDGDGTVTDGDRVQISATVDDATSGVDTVTVDASALGGPSTLSLTESSGSYTGAFTVAEPSVGDGATSLTVTATDSVGYTDTGSDSITVTNSIDTVDSLTIDADFVGVAADSDTSIRVTASGIKDADGNPISNTNAQLQVGSHTYTGIDVSDGSLDTTIDPTAISDTASTGQTTVRVANADDSATDTVVLVHEVIGLSSGYNLVGTPMTADDVRFTDVSDVTTYDPTVSGDNSEWVAPNEKQVGEGYYAFAESDDARVGYVFSDTGADNPDARYLHNGYNLVGAGVDLTQRDSTTIGTDLGAGIDPSSNSDVSLSTYTGADLEDEATGADNAFTTASDTDSVSAYDGYFVKVENGKVVRTITTDTDAYDPEDS